jgi:hypothetical protein
MKKETPISLRHLRRITAILFLCPISLSSIQASAASDQSDVSSASVRQEQTSGILRAEKINPTTVDVLFTNQQRMTIDFYGENIFRVFQDNSGGIIRDPEAKPEAQILVDQPRRKVSGLSVDEKDGYVTLTTAQVRIELNKQTGLMKVFNPLTGKCVIEEIAPVVFGPKEVTVTLKENPEEYFYGGGVQNGRFSHKGKVIAIENQNSWTDGGVASPAPFYWSTNGYGMMWYTFRKGEYDFGATEKNIVKLSHNSSYLDIFYMVNDGAVSLLNDFYQLTGNPVLLPKFGFYEGHLNAYNRDYWKEDEKGILFEDGKRYKESQKDNGGIKESLNGEKNNYQFSARAVIDRYKNHDMPLGWLLPNDGYGAGYGQTETLDGNIANLKSLGDYARKNGVEIGLWTQSDLHPKEGISALLQRDIVKEVRDAGVRVLKTDVAWVGAGYSFGLNLGAKWNNFDISVFFQGVAKRTLFREGDFAMPWSDWWRYPPQFYYGQTWNEDRQDAYYPRLTHGDIRHWNYQASTMQKINAAYVRLKNIQIGYTLPKSLLQKIGIERTRFYVSGQDLFEIHGVKGGWDPESDTGGFNYPFQRYYSFGIDLTF